MALDDDLRSLAAEDVLYLSLSASASLSVFENIGATGIKAVDGDVVAIGTSGIGLRPGDSACDDLTRPSSLMTVAPLGLRSRFGFVP